MARLLITLFSLLPLACYAQSDIPYYLQFSGNLLINVPVEGFSRVQDGVSVGGGGAFIFQGKRGKPLFFGLEAAGGRFETESIKFTTTQNGFAEDFRERTSTHLLQAHVLARFKPFTGFFLQPYADGLLGGKWLYARTVFSQEFDEDEVEVIERYTEISDNTLSVGAGAGVQVRLSAAPDLLLDFRCVYLYGGSARYWARDPDAPDPLEFSAEAFEPRISPTSTLSFQLGLTLQISLKEFHGLE
ncbi:hypothetical protein [Phaeodactylibacter luteus]|uniref:Outer membrane protein beta-barrel domain-containing protein n=1 Tax=Phaeodactylibacter luteus TaxID=1564516 RepID=A0A5C6S1Q8_9BACT|nr:hypothetical protein [Phaeodactylibacter luteus]TXB67572.1 hypothetical protein FRY97_04045 [Phaeodactylibacter luteus]